MPVNVSVPPASPYSVYFTFLTCFFCAPPTRAAVDCGAVSVPEDGILEAVESKQGRTLYKDQIQFKCTSKYYTLEGDGDYRLCQHRLSKPLFTSVIFSILPDTYTCSADGEWKSLGGKSEIPKCVEGVLSFCFFDLNDPHLCPTPLIFSMREA